MVSPPHSPEQSGTQSLVESASQVPQLSSNESPLGVPAQSQQDELSPSHTPHSSPIPSPHKIPAQSTSLDSQKIVSSISSQLVTQISPSISHVVKVNSLVPQPSPSKSLHCSCSPSPKQTPHSSRAAEPPHSSAQSLNRP